MSDIKQINTLTPKKKHAGDKEDFLCKKKKKDDSSEESSVEDEEEDVSSSEEEEDDKVSFSTTDILANDPLYFVLSKIFITEDNKNIANVLQEINTKLDTLLSKKKH